MASSGEAAVELGVLGATPSQLDQIVAWAAAFGSLRAHIAAADAIGLEPCDLYLLVAKAGDRSNGEVGKLVQQAAYTPCIVLGTEDDDALAGAAAAAGATGFLPMPALAAAELERLVQFGLGRRRLVGELAARTIYVAAAAERERQQVANALHDGPLQDLIGARFLLSALGADSGAADVQNSLQAVAQAIRSLCSELKPPALGPFGLEKAIRAHMQNFHTRYPDLTLTLELDGNRQQLPEWARFALFRVFQESILNIEKHARAAHVWVRLRLDDGEVRLTVADDGQGFDAPPSWLDFARTARFGLLLMQERVDALQGRMVVQSTVGSGTRVMVQAPLDQPLLPLPTYLVSAGPDRNG